MESYCLLNTSRSPTGSTLIISQWKNELRHPDTFFKLSSWNNMFASSKLPVLTTISLSSALVTVKFSCLIKIFQGLSDNVSIGTSLLPTSIAGLISYVGKSDSWDSSFTCSKYMCPEKDKQKLWTGKSWSLGLGMSVEAKSLLTWWHLETAGAPTFIFAMSSILRMQASEPNKVPNSLLCLFRAKK